MKVTQPVAHCRTCGDVVKYDRGRPPVWCDEHHPSMAGFEPKETAWPIVGKCKEIRANHVEVIDRAGSHVEATRLVKEYSMAFGPTWNVSTFEKAKSVDWEPRQSKGE